jgi:hypothetical protein
MQFETFLRTESQPPAEAKNIVSRRHYSSESIALTEVTEIPHYSSESTAITEVAEIPHYSSESIALTEVTEIPPQSSILFRSL